MGRRPFFIESKIEARDWLECDRCHRLIAGLGKWFWNPNKRARIRDLCGDCYESWRWEREEAAKTWIGKHKQNELCDTGQLNFGNLCPNRTSGGVCGHPSLQDGGFLCCIETHKIMWRRTGIMQTNEDGQEYVQF